MAPQFPPLASALMGLAMLGVFALVVGGYAMIARRRETRKGWLMIVAALVLLGNVLVWVV